VLESLIHLGNTLGLQMVAQGIETPQQLAALSRMGCALGQGPLLSPPLDQERALALAESGYGAFASGI
jgi:EAL domain-containing protein (putative c-di-GMP-specific phosphodiesterase class I)